MRFTLQWLKQFLDTDSTLRQITDRLTSLGLEVEEVIDRSEELRPFKVAEIVEAVQHPNADKLRVCKVNTGSETLQIVCGAPNARAGIKVVLAPVGSVIPEGAFTIKASAIRGVESNGMLCSAGELRTGEDSNGIIELPEDSKPGSDFAAICGLDDPVIEIAITPNRGDCLGVYGIARDLAASGLGTLKTLEVKDVKGSFPSPVQVNISEGSPVFIGRYFKGVKNGQSPAWLKQRLTAIGVKPISALVDITNYISFSFARPLHVYDAEKLKGNITVRSAREGESFTALNDKSYSLKPAMVVISDEAGPLGLGGIIGGKESGCSEETTDVFLESALFDAGNIADTGRALQIDSDARYRFERQVDPAFTQTGADIASQMILELCGGEASSYVIAGKIPEAKRTISFDFSKVATLGGVTLENTRITEILARLGFTVNGNQVTVPSWRPDVEGAADLVEEVLRINGYDAIPVASLPEATDAGPALSPSQRRTATLRRLLASRGLTEAVTWSFTDEAKARSFGWNDEALRLLNPISSELSVMRPSILPNLLEALAKNSTRGFADISLFEVGPIFHGITPEQQQVVISGIRGGKSSPKTLYGEGREVDIFDAKADCFAIIEECGLSTERLSITADAPAWYHPGRSGTVRLGKEALGTLGEIHPSILQQFGLKQRVVAFELVPLKIPQSKPKQGRKGAPQLSSYQAVSRDFAFLVESGKTAESILKAVRGADKTLIKDIALFDVYSGKGVEPGKKSVAINVTLQAMDRTLKDEEIEQISATIIKEVEKATGGTLRG